MPREEFYILPPLKAGDIVSVKNSRDSYRIVGTTVNNGGFGRIYRALKEPDDVDAEIRKFAIKEFCVNSYARYAYSFVSIEEDTYNQMRKRIESLQNKFFVEAKMLGVIRSEFSRKECIPKIFGYPFSAQDGRLVYVMEYIEGPTLTEEIMNWGPMPEKEAVAIVCQVADVLMQAHKNGIVHCDVSPNNIILRNGIPVLVDFGNARSYDDEMFFSSMGENTREMFLPYQRALDDSMRRMGVTDEDLNEINRKIGSPGFSAPASCKGRVMGDVYSTAMTLYYLLTAEVPHMDDPEHMRCMLKRNNVSDLVVKAIFDNAQEEVNDFKYRISVLKAQLQSACPNFGMM